MEGEMVGGWVKQSAFTIDLQHSLAPSTQFGTTLLNVQSYDCDVLHHSFTTVLCRENSLFFFLWDASLWDPRLRLFLQPTQHWTPPVYWRSIAFSLAYTRRM